MEENRKGIIERLKDFLKSLRSNGFVDDGKVVDGDLTPKEKKILDAINAESGPNIKKMEAYFERFERFEVSENDLAKAAEKARAKKLVSKDSRAAKLAEAAKDRDRVIE